jgi:ATP-binding cassette subfamily C protein EexD
MAGFFSLFVNLLMLAPAVYMLEVYDRVLPSSSQPTLVMLTLIVMFLFVVLGALEWVRSQILIATSARIDGVLGGRVFDAVFVRSLASSGRISNAQPLGDLMQLRQFLTGSALFAFFDAPWVPIYIGVMFLFHPLYGVVAVVSALVLVGLTVWGEQVTRGDLDRSTQLSQEAAQRTQQQLRNTEVIEALGMRERMRERWQQLQSRALALQIRASRQGGMVATLSKVFRLTVQSLILGLGAWLAIHKEITPGLLIAGAILLGRSLAPLDLMIAGWRGFQGARGAYDRLAALLAAAPVPVASMVLPEPDGRLSLDRVSVRPPGSAEPILRNVSLELPAGSTLGVVGPSGSGKSTLLRTILGLYPLHAGTVRLDGAELSHWTRERLGPHLGYLPQDVELLEGTVAENIARFGEVDGERVVAAARAAGVHELILHLAEGYETVLAGDLRTLSAGQRQRIGLARALYGNPCLIVLDEPNSNLDQEGEAALAQTLRDLKAQGRTIVVVSHRAPLLEQLDLLAVLLEGQLTRFGPREKVVASLQGTPKVASSPLRSASASG